jgi:hypothetical protein
VQEISKQISEFDKDTNVENLTKILEELRTLLASDGNNKNFALCGGMKQTLSLIFSHPDPNVKILAC